MKNLLLDLDGTDKHNLINALYYLDTPIGQEIYSAFKAAIIKTNADILIAGSGTAGDFAQFIIINGQFFSIASIIEKVADTVGQSHTMSKESDITDVLTLSITGASEL
jgi:hypothetical protein